MSPSSAFSVHTRHTIRRQTVRRFAASALSLLALGGIATSCASDSDELQLTGAAARGQTVYTANRCSGCHSDDGAKSAGPTFKGVWGSSVTLKDGSTVTFDRDYLAESVADPSAQIVEGFAGIMPKVSLTNEQIDDLAAFLEAIGPGK